MKKRLFSLSRTHSSEHKVFTNPFKKVRARKSIKLAKPGKTHLVLFLSFVFLLICVVLYNFPSILPVFESGSQEIIAPNALKPSLSVFNTQLKSKNIQFDTMKVATESPTVVVYLSDGAYAYLDLNTDAASQVDLLSLILSRISQEANSKKLKYVDLRFDKPVVKF